MKRLFTSALALAAAGFFGASAGATDLNIDGRTDLYEPAPAASKIYFQGLAVGFDAGGQFTSVQLNDNSGNFFDGISSDGLIGGAHLEYLFAVDRFRLGAYGEGGFSNVNTDIGTPEFDLLKQDSYYGTGLKAGATVYGSTLVYARVGYDWSQWKAFEAVDADVGSWLVGGGIETMIAENVSFGLNADYLIVDDVEAAGADLTEIFEDSEMIRVKARLTWRQ